MPKPSSRFRTRKINFKSSIPVYVGSFELPFDDEAYLLENSGYGASPGPGHGVGPGIPGFSNSPSNSNGLPNSENGDAIRVETGVDKEEEREHHLQAAISASAAALQRGSLGRSASGSGPNGASGSTGASKAAAFHIPTPDATGTVLDYEELYVKNAYTDPFSYNKSSETVEETMGIAYTMDEEDEDWLDDFNFAARAIADKNKGKEATAQLKTVMEEDGGDEGDENRPPPSATGQRSAGPNSPSINGSNPSPIHTPLLARNGHYPPLGALSGFKSSSGQGSSSSSWSRKAHKAALAAAASRDMIENPIEITEDDFELVMDLLERATDDKYPTLHSDVSRMPSLDDLDESFVDFLPTNLVKAAKSLAQAIYPHWRTRRLNAGGKNICPQLDYDMTNESPYVCFRRREVKTARKTRRTDTQTIDKLVRLKSDLSSAQELFTKVLDRERAKRDLIVADGKILECRIRARHLKRKLGEGHGDENLLVSRRERKHKSGQLQPSSASSNKILIPNRTALAGLAPGLMPDPLPPYKDKSVHALQRIEKDMQRKREQEFGWEDLTDTAYQPAPLPMQSRFWAAPERILRYADSSARKTHEIIMFDQSPPSFGQRFAPRYRKRVGRGGRIHLDRLHARWVSPDSSPSSSSASENEDDDDDIEGDGERRAERRAASRRRKRERLERLRERWRYDADLPQEIPTSRHPAIFDDYEAKYANARCSLLASADWDSMSPATAHVEEAMRWTMREPDRLPPLQIIGKLPGQRIQPFSPSGNNNLQQQQHHQQGQGQQQHHARSASAGLQSPQLQAQQQQQLQAMQAQLQNQAQAAQQVLQLQQQHQQAQQQAQQQLQQQQQQQAQQQAQPSPVQSAQGGVQLPQQPQIRRLMWESGGA